jgi:mannose-6-phosphate isomerase-like protein (cupin superfamily)
MGSLDDLPLAGEAVAKDFDGWSEAVREEFARHAFNGHVGGVLLRETDRVRVWDIRLAPGERLPAHRHVLDYFWTALTDGRSRQHVHDGTTREVSYRRGETRSYTFGPGAYLLHDLENVGDGPLAFITVELLESANRPLPLG